MALAQWIVTASRPSICGRSTSAARSRSSEPPLPAGRVTETLGLLYADHWPYRQMATARGVRRSPVHEQLKARGAVFGEVAGWERANWFADEGQAREYRYSWQRQNWFDNQKRRAHGRARGRRPVRHDLLRQDPGRGRDAPLAYLQRLCANEMNVEPGRIVYTQMLNTRGGIECDLTVTRLSETAFLLVVPGATLQRDLSWLRRASRRRIRGDHRHDGGGIRALRHGAERAIFYAGREPDDFSNEAHPLRHRARDRDRHGARPRAPGLLCRRARLGALRLVRPGGACVRDAGGSGKRSRAQALRAARARQSCRIEKAFRHFGHDITDEDHVLEAGLGFAVKHQEG
jgi:hypothetical protein